MAGQIATLEAATESQARSSGDMMNKIAQFVDQRVAQWVNRASHGVGEVTAHMREALRLNPEVSRIETMIFEAAVGNVGGATNVIVQPSPQRESGEWDFALERILGWMQNDPGISESSNASNRARISFSVREDGMQRQVFANAPVSMASLVSGDGSPAGPIQYPRGLYVFRAGADINVTFSPTLGPGGAGSPFDVALGPWLGVNRIVGISLIGSLVRKGIDI
jgi:hypothetical protein